VPPCPPGQKSGAQNVPRAEQILAIGIEPVHEGGEECTAVDRGDRSYDQQAGKEYHQRSD
jgi:hypothetical protein